jgi:hypothetical protein
MEYGVAMSIELNYADFQRSLASGDFSFPRSSAPFILMDRRKYQLFRDSLDLDKCWRSPDFNAIKQRTGADFFARIRGACGFSMGMAATFFPAYRFFVEEFLRDEWLAAVDWHKGFHRDHVIHQVLTAYVGHKLLYLNASENPFAKDRTLLDDIVRRVLGSPGCAFLRDHMRKMGVPEAKYKDTPCNRVIWQSLILDTFCLAALFHDIGYPWQFSANVHKLLDPLMPMEMPHALHRDELVRRFGARLLFAPFHGYDTMAVNHPGDWQTKFGALVTDALATTHGFPGALAFLHLNDMLRRFPDDKDRPLRRFCVEWAALAIMMHDFGKMYMSKDGRNPQFRISYARDPLSFLLTLSDTIQGFSRPNAMFSPGSGNTCRTEFTEKCSKVTLEWEDSNAVLTLKYHYPQNSDRIVNATKHLPKEEREIFDPRNGFLDFSATRIKQVKMLATF